MKLKTVVKAFRVLETLCESSESMPLMSLAESTHMAKPTVYRILQTLVELGYADQLDSGHYVSTHKINRLQLAEKERFLLAMAQPLMIKLNEKTGETINLGVLRRSRAMYLHVVETQHALRLIMTPHSTDPLYSTAIGRVLLAGQDPAQRDYLIDQIPLKQITPKTVTDRSRLVRLLGEIQEQGHAIDREENELGCMCVAAPIKVNSTVLAAISISAPVSRVDQKAERFFIEQIQRTSSDISRRLSSSRKVLETL